MYLLVCNAGSTSLKLKLYAMPEERVLAECRMDRIGDAAGGSFSYSDCWGAVKQCVVNIQHYEQGLHLFMEQLGMERLHRIEAVGFKSVLSRGHTGVHRIDAAVLEGMREYLSVAPVHNRCYLEVIGVFQKLLPKVPLIGAFETAFHQTLAPEAYTYALPYAWQEQYGVRRYGYHGASHSYVAEVLKEKLGNAYRAVSCHLGGSSSLAAIVDGKGIDTSFGLSLQAGVPQSNRCGDMDPFIIFHMIQKEGWTPEQVKEALESQSGLKGISGLSGDMRDLEQATAQGNERAKLAIEIYCREIARYIGGYTALMGGLDAIAFTGGVGENSNLVRSKVLSYFAYLGATQPEKPEKGKTCEVSGVESKVKVFVIPANEELGVARKTYAAVMKSQKGINE